MNINLANTKENNSESFCDQSLRILLNKVVDDSDAPEQLDNHSGPAPTELNNAVVMHGTSGRGSPVAQSSAINFMEEFKLYDSKEKMNEREIEGDDEVDVGCLPGFCGCNASTLKFMCKIVCESNLL
eukprot:TRINITY_DN11769_c0_g1_i1.p2 TRINITY_DN11769_c0_g1~~TRINITY_DN11769_c0_g1_i1.p2  ORF type:complete len:127 (+),score=11.38 TRINITY_DN11769_c0_g1_i1:161-541(+)